MKRSINFITISLVSVLMFFGCDNYLEEDPRDQVSPENFFNTPAEFKLAIAGLYDTYKHTSLHGNIGLYRFYENGADVIGPSRVFDQVEPAQSYSLGESNISAISQGGGAPLTWQYLYAIVLNANTILDQLEMNDNLAHGERDLFEAETLFLRAQDILPSSFASDDLGRVSKWVAATVMVKIYLIQKKWQQARDKALEIINSSPHSLLDDYAFIFDSTNEYNAESIWEIDFAKDIQSDNWVDHFTPRIRDEPADPDKRSDLSEALSAGNEGFTGFGLAVPLPDFVNEFPMDDLRRAANITTEYLGFELNFPYMPKRWNLDQINSPRTNHGDNKIIFRLADVLLMAAGAENELNGPGNAYQYINRVRERAFEPDQPFSSLSQQEFREAIYDERRWELGGEGHRRMDLIRWGILLDVVKTTEYRLYDPASNIQPYHVLLPIPPEEFNLNPFLLESDPTNNGYR